MKHKKHDVLNQDVATRKHHIPRVGCMEFSNGFGVRWDCSMCSRGLTSKGEVCPVCGPLPE